MILCAVKAAAASNVKELITDDDVKRNIKELITDDDKKRIRGILKWLYNIILPSIASKNTLRTIKNLTSALSFYVKNLCKIL